MRKPRSLLLIEDDRLLGSLYRQLLFEAGYEITWSENAHQALAELERQHFDVILMDVMLPEMSGIELLDKLTDCPVIALTNLDQSKVREELTRKGVIGVVIKSDHTPDTFLSTVAGFVTQLGAT